jgi:hypothetical protein
MLSSGLIYSYDILILATGLQDQTLKTLPQPQADKDYPVDIADGAITLNDEADALQLARFLHTPTQPGGEKWIDDEEEVCVVYGSTLRAYACLHGLITAGVSGKKIIFVRPPRDEENPHSLHEEKRYDAHPIPLSTSAPPIVTGDKTPETPFDDSIITKLVEENLREQGVRILDSYKVVSAHTELGEVPITPEDDEYGTEKMGYRTPLRLKRKAWKKFIKKKKSSLKTEDGLAEEEQMEKVGDEDGEKEGEIDGELNKYFTQGGEVKGEEDEKKEEAPAEDDEQEEETDDAKLFPSHGYVNLDEEIENDIWKDFSDDGLDEDLGDQADEDTILIARAKRKRGKATGLIAESHGTLRKSMKEEGVSAWCRNENEGDAEIQITVSEIDGTQVQENEDGTGGMTENLNLNPNANVLSNARLQATPLNPPPSGGDSGIDSSGNRATSQNFEVNSMRSGMIIDEEKEEKHNYLGGKSIGGRGGIQALRFHPYANTKVISIEEQERIKKESIEATIRRIQKRIDLIKERKKERYEKRKAELENERKERRERILKRREEKAAGHEDYDDDDDDETLDDDGEEVFVEPDEEDEKSQNTVNMLENKISFYSTFFPPPKTSALTSTAQLNEEKRIAKNAYENKETSQPFVFEPPHWVTPSALPQPTSFPMVPVARRILLRWVQFQCLEGTDPDTIARPSTPAKKEKKKKEQIPIVTNKEDFGDDDEQLGQSIQQPTLLANQHEDEEEEEEVDILAYSPRLRCLRRVYKDGTSRPPAPPPSNIPQGAVVLLQRQQQNELANQIKGLFYWC